MKNLTFESLPTAVAQLHEKLENIERMLQSQGTQNPSTPASPLLTVREAAEFLSLAVPTVYSMVSRGELPHMKRSKRLYFDRNELMAYLKEGRQKTNEEIEQDALDCLTKKRRG